MFYPFNSLSYQFLSCTYILCINMCKVLRYQYYYSFTAVYIFDHHVWSKHVAKL
jgi:hypothetical protein